MTIIIQQNEENDENNNDAITQQEQQQQDEEEEEEEIVVDAVAVEDDVERGGGGGGGEGGEASAAAAASPASASSTEQQSQQSQQSQQQQREFPSVFYDPFNPTQIIKEPVVAPNGDTYEKSTAPPIVVSPQEDGTAIEYYPNRALQTIIHRETELADSGSIRGRLRRIDESVRNVMGGLLEKSVWAVEHRPLPESYYCIITGELITDPVISKEGYTYERDAIENWIKSGNHESPMTRNPLELRDLRDNNALYELIQSEKRGRSLEEMHPSIRRWKESGLETSERRNFLAEDLEDAANVQGSSAAATGSGPEGSNPEGVDATGSGTSHDYPTTEAEIRRRQFDKMKCKIFTLAAIAFTVVFLLYSPGASGTLLIIFIVLLVIIGVSSCFKGRNNS